MCVRVCVCARVCQRVFVCARVCQRVRVCVVRVFVCDCEFKATPTRRRYNDQIVSSMRLSDDVRTAVGNIVSATRAVLGIIHQLLDYGRVCAGRRMLVFE